MSRGQPTRRGKYQVPSGIVLVPALEDGAIELLRNLWRPISDPRHVCGPECYAVHGEIKYEPITVSNDGETGKDNIGIVS